MKEIKFRIWDGNKKEMVNVFEMQWVIGSGWPVCINDTYVTRNNVMEFTGLKDKNGKEIYEGDIVKLYSWGVSNDDYIGTASIYWDELYYQWEYEMIDGEMIDNRYDIWRAPREVIGNIFENKELLTN